MHVLNLNNNRKFIMKLGRIFSTKENGSSTAIINQEMHFNEFQDIRVRKETFPWWRNGKIRYWAPSIVGFGERDALHERCWISS